jgi:hypothetical protein
MILTLFIPMCFMFNFSEIDSIFFFPPSRVSRRLSSNFFYFRKVHFFKHLTNEKDFDLIYSNVFLVQFFRKRLYFFLPTLTG